MSNKDKFEKDSIEELKKIRDGRKVNNYRSCYDVKINNDINALALKKLSARIDEVGQMPRDITKKFEWVGTPNDSKVRVFNSFEGATDDNHRFKFTEK